MLLKRSEVSFRTLDSKRHKYQKLKEIHQFSMRSGRPTDQSAEPSSKRTYVRNDFMGSVYKDVLKEVQ
jgi:hypothetical protein